MPAHKTRKVKKHRISPDASATVHPEGTIARGRDSHRWVVKKTAGGVKRWIPFYSTRLFGYAPLTATTLKQHIRKPVQVYEREIGSAWPTKPRDFDVKYVFTASGDAEVYKNKQVQVIPRWLTTRVPAVKKNDTVLIAGSMKSKDISATLQVAPAPGELVSTNLMNTEAFVKCSD